MAKKTNVKQEISAPVGFNLYQDKKNRTIYKYPLSKEAVYIPVYDYKTFDLYRKRYILVLSVFIVLFTVFTQWFDLPWWFSIVITLLVWGFMEYKFSNFLKGQQPVKHFDPKSYKGYYDSFEEQGTKRVLIKILLYLLIGILIVYNSYYSHFDSMYITASWAVLVICVLYALFQIVVLIKISLRKKAS